MTDDADSSQLPSSSVTVFDIMKLVSAVLRYEERDCKGLNGRVSPSSVVDATGSIDVIDIVSILP